MTESSGLWTTAGSPSGDQVTSYTQAIATTMLEIAAACSGFEGVAPGYLNELAPSTTGAFNVRIASGGAMVDGKYYKNTANVDKTLDTPTAGTTRIDRVVVEVTWASFECEITVIKGTETGGTPSAPSIPSTAGTNYAIQICQALVNNAGDVTITDERTWAITPTDDSTLEDNGAGALRIKDSGVTAAKIANRARHFFVPAVEMVDNLSSGDDVPRNELAGYEASTTADKVYIAFGEFVVPTDYASAMTAKAVYQPGATGDVYTKNEARYGASGESYSTHTADDGGYAAVAVTNAQLFIGQSMSLSSAASGDIVSLAWYRDGDHVSDTVNAYVYFKGWLVEYTADS